MGCGSSNGVRLIDEPNSKKNENENNNENNNKTKTAITKLPNSCENLQNIDLLKRFLARPIIKKYLKTFLPEGKIDESYYRDFENLFNEIKPDFDELFERLGMKYEIRTDETFNVNVTTYWLWCYPCTQISIDLYMPIIFIELCLYPKSLFEKSKVKKYVFIESLDFSTETYSQYRAACPEFNLTFGMYYCVKERNIAYINQVFHHELFHFIDWIDDYSFESKPWREFNTPDFSYGNGGHNNRVWKPLSPEVKGFLNFYSTTAIEEDKAEIFQYFMNRTEESLVANDEIIRKKVNFMKKFLEGFDPKGFGCKDFDYFQCIIDFREKYYIPYMYKRK